MLKISIIKTVVLISLTGLWFLGCSERTHNKEAKRDWSVEKIQEIQQVRPEKPVKIKVKRDVQGRYSWELSGDNPDEIIRIDRKLRKGLIVE